MALRLSAVLPLSALRFGRRISLWALQLVARRQAQQATPRSLPGAAVSEPASTSQGVPVALAAAPRAPAPPPPPLPAPPDGSSLMAVREWSSAVARSAQVTPRWHAAVEVGAVLVAAGLFGTAIGLPVAAGWVAFAFTAAFGVVGSYLRYLLVRLADRACS